MRSTFRASLLAAACLGATAPAQAESVQDESARHMIVVTGTKKAAAQDLLDVPVAIEVVRWNELEARSVRTLSDLTHAAPNVSLDQVGTFRGVANWSIRGLGINSSIASIEPAVATYVDGVYLGINPGASLDLFDVSRVEVLRGPQGTLYGRNATGGAVLLQTADPEQRLGFSLRGSGDGPVDGGRGAMNLTIGGHVNVPLAPGIAVRLAGHHNADGGWFRNLANGGNLGKAQTDALRGSVLVERGALRLVAKTEYLKTVSDGAVGQNHGLFARNTFDVALDNEGSFRARSRMASLNADYELGTGKLTYVFGWRRFSQFTFNDIDSSPVHRFHSHTGLRQTQWSHEARWAGELAEGVELTAGGNAFRQTMAYEEDRIIPPNPLFFGGGRQKQRGWGLFAQGDWEVVPALTLTGGLRWSREAKAADVTFVRIRPACSVLAGTCPISGTNPSIPGEANGFSDKRRWANWSPKLGLTWEVDSRKTAYAHWSRAWRSGGYNLRVTQPAAFLANALAAGTPAFGAERVDGYELGLKLATDDRRGSLNLALFENRVRGMQREVSQADGGSGLAQSIYNTANARIRGFEAEARFTVNSRLRLGANLGHIDADYTRALYDISGDGAVNAADLALKLPRAPAWTWGLGLEAELPLGDVSAINASLRFQHRARFAYTDNNFGWMGAQDHLDARLTWKLPVPHGKTGGGWRIALYGRNLLDEVQFGGDTQIPWGGALSDGNNRPFDPRPAAGTFSPLTKGRTLGVEVAIDY